MQTCVVRHDPDGLFALSLQIGNDWESSGEGLGDVWETFGRRLGDVWETPGRRRLGDVWETSGRRPGVVWETSGRRLGDVRETSGGRLGGATGSSEKSWNFMKFHENHEIPMKSAENEEKP